MPDLQPFRGLRYDLGHVGSLSNVICPPYDVIGPDLQEQLYKQHPANVVRLEWNREEPGDDAANNRYSRASKFLRDWRSEGVLVQEKEPALYIYDQVFTYAGQTHTRRGFMARCRLQRFGEGNIYPHEETMSGPKADRLLLMKACKTNLSQIFGLYPDPRGSVNGVIEAFLEDAPAVEATDHLGVVHRMWALTDADAIAAITGLMEAKPMFIADGHHRYETACNYRDELSGGGYLAPEHPANFVLMMCVGMSDPGLLVLPTHRLFRGLPAMTSAELIAKLGDSFACRVAGEGKDLAPAIWKEIETEGEQATMGLFTANDKKWVVARVTPAGRKRMSQVASEHSEHWQGLGVSLLHRLLVDTLLAARNLPKPRYVHLVEEVVESLGSGEDFPLAVLVMPATVEHVRLISEQAERMPAKSTYFYPKLVSGLALNPLD